MTKLEFYRKTYRAYWLSQFLPSKWLNPHRGFCHFWRSRSMGESFKVTDLYLLAVAHPEFSNMGYWFERGKIKPRLQVLKTAIKNLEK